MHTLILADTMLFLSTLSLRRATIREKKRGKVTGISIHALLAESDLKIGKNFTDRKHFYPRSPCGERPLLSSFIIVYVKISIHALLAESDSVFFIVFNASCSFLSTLSLRRATWPGLLARPFFIISIHALLAESDPSSTVIVILRKNFYPRSPCGERQQDKRHQRHEKEFLSTLSLRRATISEAPSSAPYAISIHALLAESDGFCRITAEK